MENEQLLNIKNDLVLNITGFAQEAFEEYLRDEDSNEAYYSLQISLEKMYSFRGLLDRNFADLDLKSIYDEIKKDVLKAGKEYCEDYGYELTEKHLDRLDKWLK